MPKKKAVKRGVLSELDKAAIKKHRDKDMDYLYKKTLKSKILIQKYLDSLQEVEDAERAAIALRNAEIALENAVPAVESKAPEPDPNNTILKPYDLFARNKKMGATVMTKEAAMLSDELKSSRPKHNPSFIHKIRNE